MQKEIGAMLEIMLKLWKMLQKSDLNFKLIATGKNIQLNNL